MIDRLSIYMGDFLNEKGVRAIWDPMYNLLMGEWKRHRDAVYNNPWWPNYDDELRSSRNWLSQRTAEMYKHIGSQFSLGSPIPLTINVENSEEDLVGLTFNDVPLTKNSFDGKFYFTRAIRLENNNDERPITGWRIAETKSGSTTTREISGSTLSLEMPACSKLAITAIVGTPDGIGTITTLPDLSQGNVYDLNGRIIRQGTTSLEGLPHGIYIVNRRKVIK